MVINYLVIFLNVTPRKLSVTNDIPKAWHHIHTYAWAKMWTRISCLTLMRSAITAILKLIAPSCPSLPSPSRPLHLPHLSPSSLSLTSSPSPSPLSLSLSLPLCRSPSLHLSPPSLSLPLPSSLSPSPALSYECICTVSSIYPNNAVIAKTAKVLSRFVTSANNNWRYLGINGLASLVQVSV